MPVYFPTNGVEAVELNFTLLKGEGLAAKDRNMMGKRTTSDPYCIIELETSIPPAGRSTRAKKEVAKIGKTQVIKKTVNPDWNETFSTTLPCAVLQDPKNPPKISFKIFDYDKGSDDDPMGTVTIPIKFDPPKNSSTTEWYTVPKDSAKNAKGKLQIQMTQEICRSTTLQRGNAFPLETNRLRVGLAWDLAKGKVIDLDASCVAVDSQGKISMDNSVYYGNLANANGSIKHSGDSRDGNKEGEDESMSFQLDKVSPKILALYIIMTVASNKRYLSSVTSARVTLVDEAEKGGKPMASFAPSKHVDSKDATALFLVRLARNGSGWIVQPIEDTHQSARDFGSLIPHIKSYTKDLIPNIRVDPSEKVSVMRKGGAIKIKDFCPAKKVPDKVTFGLSWDMTRKPGQDAKKIDLDASAICLDADLQCVDKIWFKHLNSEDGAIKHMGDQRSGDAGGDDETINLETNKVAARIHYIGFVVNSYSGEELDDVQKAACHLFDTNTGKDIALHALSDCAFLDGHTALVMGVLYRVRGSTKKESEWCLKIISQAAQGKTVKDNIDELQKYLEENPVFTPMSGPEEEGGVENVDSQMPPEVPVTEG